MVTGVVTGMDGDAEVSKTAVLVEVALDVGVETPTQTNSVSQGDPSQFTASNILPAVSAATRSVMGVREARRFYVSIPILTRPAACI